MVHSWNDLEAFLTRGFILVNEPLRISHGLSHFTWMIPRIVPADFKSPHASDFRNSRVSSVGANRCSSTEAINSFTSLRFASEKMRENYSRSDGCARAPRD